MVRIMKSKIKGQSRTLVVLYFPTANIINAVFLNVNQLQCSLILHAVKILV